MDKTQLNESLRSGEYYRNSIAWYNSIFVFPILPASIYIIIIAIFFGLLITITFNAISILPMSRELVYTIQSDGREQMKASIIKVDDSKSLLNDSIAKLLIKNYIIARENYDYSKLLQQYQYMNNTSSITEYEKFKDYMSLNNINSPILKYKKGAVRTVDISYIKFFNDHIEVFFNAKAISDQNFLLENSSWKVVLKYEMDSIDINASGEFNFIVTYYYKEMVKDLMK
jgi:type IV secretory pathway component VirB8